MWQTDVIGLASPLIFFHRGSYNNDSPGTFRYALYDRDRQLSTRETPQRYLSHKSQSEEEMLRLCKGINLHRLIRHDTNFVVERILLNAQALSPSQACNSVEKYFIHFLLHPVV
jgi:hypothetical protein